MPTVLFRDDAEDLFFAHDQVLLAIELDLLAGVLAEEHRVAFLHIERRDLAVLLDLALADRDDLTLLRLLLGRIRDDDPADFLFPFFDASNDDAIVQGTDPDFGLR